MMSMRNLSVQSLRPIPQNKQLSLAWDNIHVSFCPRQSLRDFFTGQKRTNEKKILQRVSGVARPGKLMALMGASGAGKTTLLNVLSRRRTDDLAVSGKVLLNGEPLSKIDSPVGELIGYVQQNDLLPPALTVREYLTFSATLTLGKLTSYQIEDKVDELLSKFSLLECADSLIDVGHIRISGSERKRVSVACKMFSERRVLLLDEPTTGLDSSVAYFLILTLRSLCDLGYNIICTIHQPSTQVFNMFDTLFLLAEGRCAYFGARSKAVEYFSDIGYNCPDTFSPSDFFIDVLAIKPGNEEALLSRVNDIADAFDEIGFRTISKREFELENARKGIDQVSLMREDADSCQLPWVEQFVYLFWRSSVGIWREPRLNILRVLLIGLACALIVMSYMHLEETYTVSRANNIQGLLFLLASFFIIWNSLLVLAVLPKDLPLLIREHQDGLYKLSAYYTTTFLVQSLVGTIFMVGSVLSIYFFVGLKRDPGCFFINLLVLVIVYLINVGFDALISAICEAPGKTVSNAIPCVILSNVTGGYFCILGSMPRYLNPILAINWLPWGYELLSINQWNNVSSIECDREPCLFEDGQGVLRYWGLSQDAFNKDMTYIVCQLIGYHVLAFIILALKMRFKWAI